MHKQKNQNIRRPVLSTNYQHTNTSHKKRGFTLVELIVVITILAILGTIAFIALQGYSTSTRDSVRISDISSMKSSLEVFKIESGKYPKPTNGVNITFSGGVVWNQGVFGETVFTNTTNLDKIPTDPNANNEYTYSTTSTRTEFEIGGILEGGGLTFYQKQANAGEIDATAIVSGTYNGLMTKSLSGTLCNILSIPTIISNDIETSTDLVHIIASGSLVYNGYRNLPAIFRSSKYKINGGFDFKPTNLVAYSDTGSCNDLLDKTDYKARVSLLKGLQDSYSGTILKNVGIIGDINKLVIDKNFPSSEVVKNAGNLVNNNLGGNIPTDTKEAVCGGTKPDGLTNISNSNSIGGGNWSYNLNPGVCTFICNTGYEYINGLCSKIKYTVSGSFGSYANGATINVCGTNITANSSGGFTALIDYGTNCSNITSTRTGYTCLTNINGPSSLTSNITNISGLCEISTPFLNTFTNSLSCYNGNCNNTVNNDGVVYDSKTSLYWQSSGPSSTYTWVNAKTYCANLVQGGFDDWRLPDRSELLSILDYTKYNPAINTNVFHCYNARYMSSTSFYNSTSKRFVHFADGGTDGDGLGATGYIRCVR